MRKSYLCLSFGLTLIACGGTVSGADDADDDDVGGASNIATENPSGTPGCFDAEPGDGIGSHNCSPNHDYFEEPAACVAASCITVTSSENSPTDGCEWALTCDGSIALTVECDGENDGTNTSLCGCMVDGEFVKDAGLVQGEGVDACLAAYINCLDPSCTQGVDPPPCTESFTEPTGCSLPGTVVVIPSELSPSDGCEGSYACDGAELGVRCDGENDGTNTSLCDCYFNGEVKYAGLTEGEGETACNNAFAFCLDPTACAD